DQQGLGLVGDGGFDAGFEEAAGDGEGAGEVALGDLVGFADIEGEGAVGEVVLGGGGIHFHDLPPRPLKKFLILRRHVCQLQEERTGHAPP
ncbi:MAG: hypothetical protein C4345_13000, partial [Chloroflexota bacterium]